MIVWSRGGRVGKDGSHGAKLKSYAWPYRREAAYLVIDTGRSGSEVVREIGVGEQVLGHWVVIERAHMGYLDGMS